MIGSSSGWGSRYQRTADRMERCVQQSWTDWRRQRKVGGIRPRWKKQRNKPGREEAVAQRQFCQPGWSDMWGWQFASLNKEKPFGMWLGRWRACSDERVDLKWTDFQNKYINMTDTYQRTSGTIISKFSSSK